MEKTGGDATASTKDAALSCATLRFDILNNSVRCDIDHAQELDIVATPSNDVLLEGMSCVTCTNNKIDVRIGQILRHLTKTWAAVFASTIDRVVSIWYLRVHFDDCVDMILILRSSVQVRGLFQDARQKVYGRLWAKAPENATCEIALWSLRIRI